MKCRVTARLLVAEDTILRVKCGQPTDHPGLHVASASLATVTDKSRTIGSADIFVLWKGRRKK